MAFDKKGLDDYNEVADRIREFREKHPEGSLQSEVRSSAFEGFVVVKAFAYRTPDDPRPGIGHAWENVPGKTPYTKDSELQNAETSAWGRAIVAALAADTKKGIASREEVARNVGSGSVRQSSSDEAGTPFPASAPGPTSPSMKDAKQRFGSDAAVLREVRKKGWVPGSINDITEEMLKDVLG